VNADDSTVVLTVNDFGVEVPTEVLERFCRTRNVGVGLAGIRERPKELGGTLEIESGLDGTLLKSTISFSSTEGSGLDNGRCASIAA
jgi:signal transduction histidine kinase